MISSSPTAPERYPIRLIGFETEEAAQSFGNTLRQIVEVISQYLDLQRLEGITVAYNYGAALADIDRGHPGLRRLAPTADYGVGIAMTVSVRRDDQIKSHIVFDACYLQVLSDLNNPGFEDALYTVAHECAHAQDSKYWELCFPGLTFQPIKDALQAYLWQISECCWNEYSASRQSAFFHPQKPSSYEVSFIATLGTVRRNANDCIIAYRIHGDNQRVLEEVLHHYGTLMKQASYLIGHQIGLGAGADEPLAVAQCLNEHEWFRPSLSKLATTLELIWSNYGAWKTIDEFEPVGKIALDLLSLAGVWVRSISKDQLYIDVPFTLETIPLSDRAAFIRHQRGGPACLDSAPRDLSGFLPGYAEGGALRLCRNVGRA